MRKNLSKICFMTAVFFVCTLVSCMTPPPPEEYVALLDVDMALEQAADQFSSLLRTGTTVAIVGIDAGEKAPSVSAYLLDELTLYLVQQGRLTVADRVNLDAIKKEMNFQLSGEVGDASIQEIGAMAGAETVIHGSLKFRSFVGSNIWSIVYYPSYILTLQALNVTTGTVETMYRETVKLNNYLSQWELKIQQ